ncbi:MAG: YwmB family TATA-box binding protein [Firmicutes bacterium]|nr:YwmB family TATA-box binding protein [Bacillota bacterium]
MKSYILLCLKFLLSLSILLPMFMNLTPGVAISDFVQYSESEEIDIRMMLNDIGSNLKQIQMNGWVRINEECMSLTSLKKLAETSLASFDNQVWTTINSNETDQIRQIKLLLTQGSIQYTITFNNGQHPDKSTKYYETYVVIDTVIDSSLKINEEAVHKSIESFLNQFSDNPYIGTTYIAGIPGDLGIKSMDEVSNQIFYGLKGKIIEGIQDRELVSKTGYTNSIKNTLITNGEKININVALRYNSYEDMTYIWLGTPIISSAY